MAQKPGPKWVALSGTWSLKPAFFAPPIVKNFEPHPGAHEEPYGLFGRSTPMGSHFGVGAPPDLEPILVGIGMFSGGTIWVLTHGFSQEGDFVGQEEKL